MIFIRTHRYLLIQYIGKGIRSNARIDDTRLTGELIVIPKFSILCVNRKH